jgi:hypothetical protein
MASKGDLVEDGVFPSAAALRSDKSDSAASLAALSPDRKDAAAGPWDAGELAPWKSWVNLHSLLPMFTWKIKL